MTTIDQAFIRAYLQETASEEAPDAPLPEAAVPEEPQYAVAEAQPAPSEQDSEAGSPVETADAEFQPMLQVDGFVWAQRATSLRLAAGIQVDRLADSLVDGLAEDRKVAGVAACQRGQGCTTVLLCAAKRLADRGLDVAVLDADFDHPTLAGRLGLLPEAGLEEVLAGRMAPEEVVIESLGDQMAVLPLAASCSEIADSPEGRFALDAAVDLLRRHHDLVLVDVGRADAHPALHSSKRQCLDAMILVQDTRSTSREELIEAIRQVKTAGIMNLGVVENFV